MAAFAANTTTSVCVSLHHDVKMTVCEFLAGIFSASECVIGKATGNVVLITGISVKNL